MTQPPAESPGDAHPDWGEPDEDGVYRIDAGVSPSGMGVKYEIITVAGELGDELDAAQTAAIRNILLWMQQQHQAAGAGESTDDPSTTPQQ